MTQVIDSFMHAGAGAAACTALQHAVHSPELLALRLCLLPVLLKGKLLAILQVMQLRTLHIWQARTECATAAHTHTQVLQTFSGKF